MYNAVNTLAPSFLIGSSSFLQVTRTTLKSWISSKFGKIQPCTAEFYALDRLKKSFTYLRSIQNILMMTCSLPGERSLPFGLLVFRFPTKFFENSLRLVPVQYWSSIMFFFWFCLFYCNQVDKITPSDSTW